MTVQPPQIENTPGLCWRKSKHGWIGTWRARTDLVQRGYEPKNAQLWLSTEDRPAPSPTIEKWISDRCVVLQEEMLNWARGSIPQNGIFTGDLKSLVAAYQHDPDSPYQKIRYKSRRSYDAACARIEKGMWTDELGVTHCIGDSLISEITARRVLRWHRVWSKDGVHITTGHGQVGMLRTLLTFGATILEDKECRAAKVTLHDMRFAMSKPRKERLTADQAVALRAMAHVKRRPSLALAQAFQFECTLRQKDVIGEYIPISEPGVSDVIDGNSKWLSGIRWEEVDEALVLKHVTSKRQKEVIVQLMLAPMVVEELKRQFPAAVRIDGSIDRAALPASGPIVVSETTGLPWSDFEFRRKWRHMATACGIPKEVFNMDTRAGAISEATDAGASLEDVRHAATHSNTSMTARYSRAPEGKIASVMQTRVAHRNKPRTNE
jgi:hypothetical protein